MAHPSALAAPVTLEDLRARRAEILRIVEAHRATNVRVFGSVAHGYWIAGAGESVKGLSSDLRARHADVNWKRATGLRDVISRNYHELELDKVWDAAAHYVPQLKAAVERILAADPAVRE